MRMSLQVEGILVALKRRVYSFDQDKRQMPEIRCWGHSLKVKE